MKLKKAIVAFVSVMMISICCVAPMVVSAANAGDNGVERKYDGSFMVERAYYYLYTSPTGTIGYDVFFWGKNHTMTCRKSNSASTGTHKYVSYYRDKGTPDYGYNYLPHVKY